MHKLILLTVAAASLLAGATVANAGIGICHTVTTPVGVVVKVCI